MSAVENDKAALSIAVRSQLVEIFEGLFDGGGDEEDSSDDGMVGGVAAGALASQVSQLAVGLKVD
jgi:hypothetical protein